jgi:hypothetical protein
VKLSWSFHWSSIASVLSTMVTPWPCTVWYIAVPVWRWKGGLLSRLEHLQVAGPWLRKSDRRQQGFCTRYIGRRRGPEDPVSSSSFKASSASFHL